MMPMSVVSSSKHIKERARGSDRPPRRRVWRRSGGRFHPWELQLGARHFPHQRSLADGYRLFFIDRRGFGQSPDADSIGWLTDVEDVTGLLDEVGPAHLVGQSYGAVVALLVAGRHPELVNSIVAIEPVFFEAARDDPRADAMTAAQKPVVERASPATNRLDQLNETPSVVWWFEQRIVRQRRHESSSRLAWFEMGASRG
jgi:pimeloyl-ACP methyl ester carboxylesterase